VVLVLQVFLQYLKSLFTLCLFFVVIIGLMSFPSGYKKHNKLHPSILGVIGTLGLFTAIFFNTNTEIVCNINIWNYTNFSPFLELQT
jgi:hypothetical protein